MMFDPTLSALPGRPGARVASSRCADDDAARPHRPNGDSSHRLRAPARDLREPGGRRGASSRAAARRAYAGLGAADAGRPLRPADGDGLAAGRAGRPGAADPPGLGAALACDPPLGPAPPRPDGGHRGAPAHRQVGRRSAAAERGAVGFPEWPRLEPRRVLRRARLFARHGGPGAAALARAGVRGLWRRGRAGGGEPRLPRHALALRRRRRLHAGHGLPLARDLGDPGRVGRTRAAARSRRVPAARAHPGRMIPRSDVVGSLLRPAHLREARQGAREGRVTPEALRDAEDRAVREAIALQEAAGLDVITDGELRRQSWVVTIPLREEGAARAPLAGFEFLPADPGWWSLWKEPDGRRAQVWTNPTRPFVTRPLEVVRDIVSDEYAFLKRHARAR